MQKVRAELRGEFTFGSCARIILISMGLALGMWYWAEKTLGPLDFNWIRAIVFSVLGGIAVLLAGAAEGCIPPTIRISAKGIHVLKVRGAIQASFKDLTAISIQMSSPAILTFRKGNRDYRYGIAETFDPELLRQELERLSGLSVQILQAGQQGNQNHKSTKYQS